MHLAGVAPDAPEEELPLVSELPLVVEPLLLPPMLEPPEVELPVLPEVPPAAAPLPTLEPDEAPVEPEVPEPELCARVAVESAKSAAAVAAVSVFNIMSVFSWRVELLVHCVREVRKRCARNVPCCEQSTSSAWCGGR